MLMPKKNRLAIYEVLFKDGAIVAKKQLKNNPHPQVETVSNLHVIKECQSLTSRGMVREQYAWSHYYWFLTNEGIQYLRDYLHLPPEIVPATLKRNTRPDAGTRARPSKPEGGPRPEAGRDRQEYRKGGSGAPDKKADAGAGAQTEFQFRGGFGRGKPQ